MDSKSPTAAVTTGEATAGKGPDVAVTTREAVTGVPSQGHVVFLTVHDAHHSKEPPGMITLSCSHSVKQVYYSMTLGCMNAFLLLLGT